MAKTNKNATPVPEALVSLRKLGSLEDVLNSGASLEIKAACIEMEIEARKRGK